MLKDGKYIMVENVDIRKAIEACKDVEKSQILGDNAKRVCKNTREQLEKTLTE